MERNTNLEYLKQNVDLFLNFMKERYPVYHRSNIFLRDIEYGIKNFFEKKDVKLTYGQIEEISTGLILHLEQISVLDRLDNNTWILNYKPEEPASAVTEQSVASAAPAPATAPAAAPKSDAESEKPAQQ